MMKSNIVRFVNEAINHEHAEINAKLRQALVNPQRKSLADDRVLAYCGIRKRYNRDRRHYEFTGSNNAVVTVSVPSYTTYRFIHGFSPSGSTYGMNTYPDDPELTTIDFYSFFTRPDIANRQVARKVTNTLPSYDLLGKRRPTTIPIDEHDLLNKQQNELSYFRKRPVLPAELTGWERQHRANIMKSARERTGYYPVVDKNGKHRIVRDKEGLDDEK